ncbi:MAG: B12-binding domain-containing protein [Desulfovermiculus sp.]|nr:B12-binding domain-containing protein [Desulfovermiculus sp.]
MANEEQIFADAKKSIVELNQSLAEEVAKKALDSGINGMELLENGYLPGLDEIGERFNAGSCFLPELIKSGKIMEKVVEIVNESLEDGGQSSSSKGKVLLATVEGDVHDIGKTIVASIFSANGFDVLDIGNDIPNDKIIDEAEKFGADIIGTSALLTTTMPQQKKLEEKLKERGLRDKYKTMIGGAPVTKKWAETIGADAYAEDASDGVKKAFSLLKK